MIMSGKPLVIFGVGELAQLAYYYFTHDSSRRVAAFTLDGCHLREDHCMGVPVLPFDKIEAHYPPEEHEMFVAIGYSRLNRARAERCQEAKTKGYRLATYVSSRSVTWPDISIGENCFVMEGNVIQPFVRIGHNVIIWCGGLISHHVEVGDNCFIAAHAVISGHVKIGAYSFIGINATLRDKIVLSERTLVGAGALVIADTRENTAHLGAPSAEAGIPSHRLQSLL
jgi:sugar O-acyltransferase (sialic acid O-acetyltransferase NeuD family)